MDGWMDIHRIPGITNRYRGYADCNLDCGFRQAQSADCRLPIAKHSPQSTIAIAIAIADFRKQGKKRNRDCNRKGNRGALIDTISYKSIDCTSVQVVRTDSVHFID